MVRRFKTSAARVAILIARLHAFKVYSRCDRDTFAGNGNNGVLIAAINVTYSYKAADRALMPFLVQAE